MMRVQHFLSILLCAIVILFLSCNDEEGELLKTLSLPSKYLSESDIPHLEKTIAEALEMVFQKIAGEQKNQIGKMEPRMFPFEFDPKKKDPLVVGFKMFEKWLRRQGCVKNVRIPIKSAEGKDSIEMLTSDPPQVSIGIDLLIADKGVQSYQLLIRVKGNYTVSLIGLERISYEKDR
ncbi:MAG: hypothetical protein HY279_13120 [Nitrospinae bacterium]|nr:hypothetical protein [Nitrospinota bacterium]